MRELQTLRYLPKRLFNEAELRLLGQNEHAMTTTLEGGFHSGRPRPRKQGYSLPVNRSIGILHYRCALL